MAFIQHQEVFFSYSQENVCRDSIFNTNPNTCFHSQKKFDHCAAALNDDLQFPADDISRVQMLLEYLNINGDNNTIAEETKTFDPTTLHFEDFDGVYYEDETSSSNNNSNYDDDYCSSDFDSIEYSDGKSSSTDDDESLQDFTPIDEWRKNCLYDTEDQLISNFQLTPVKRRRISKCMQYERQLRELEQEMEDRLIEQEIMGWMDECEEQENAAYSTRDFLVCYSKEFLQLDARAINCFVQFAPITFRTNKRSKWRGTFKAWVLR
ncbi:10159_t:CDS:2 [Ambispora gerdemannii]|uniref:10159_t:CDS:1 n=1 Tax=Ambispora gerdemannii TaxID=144530 RepID=A0A9N9F1L4_9GLOM|nr:10159_t:CDS:2 [Ambispora gerdemannii]